MKLVISFLPLGVFLFHHSRVFRFITRALLVILGIAVTSVYGVLATIFLSFYGRGEDSTVATARFVTTFFTPLLGMTCTVEGQEYLHGERPCVFICNHQSSLDMIMMAFLFPRKTVVMVKEALRYYPFLGHWLKAINCVFIKRNDRKSALDTMAKIPAILQQTKSAIWLFPEGTRSHSGKAELLPFKKGAFHLAISGQLPIIPVVFSTYGSIYNSRLLQFEGGNMRVKVLPPIETKGMAIAEVDKLIEKSHRLMTDTLKEISKKN